MLPFELTKDTPYLALSGELWSVFYEYFNRNWSCYKGFLLYKDSHHDGLHIHGMVFNIVLMGIHPIGLFCLKFFLHGKG